MPLLESCRFENGMCDFGVVVSSDDINLNCGILFYREFSHQQDEPDHPKQVKSHTLPAFIKKVHFFRTLLS